MDARIASFATAEAKARFSELLGRAEAGEELTINRHGKTVARLLPAGETREDAVTRRQASIESWIAYRKAHAITLGPDLTIRELIDDGKR